MTCLTQLSQDLELLVSIRLKKMFNNNTGDGAQSKINNGTIAWNLSRYPLTGRLKFGTYGGGNGDVVIIDNDGTSKHGSFSA